MAKIGKATLASAASAGNGSAVSWLGGKTLLLGVATFGGSNILLQIKGPNSTWVDYPNGELTENGAVALDLAPGEYRAVVGAGVTASSAYVELVGI